MTSAAALNALRLKLIWMGLGSALVLASVVVIDFELLSYGFAELGPWNTAQKFINHLILPIVVAYLPIAAATMWTTKRMLARLDEAAARLNAATHKPRGVRLSAADMPLAALPFVDAINLLLARLDEAAVRHEGFAADVAHEIKGALACLALEAGRLGAAAGDGIAAEVRRVDRLVEQLMALAQLDAYLTAPSHAESAINLHAIAQEVAASTASRARSRGLTVAVERDGDPQVKGRPELLAAAVRNLVDNAIRVTPSGGTITLRVGPGPVIAVRDGGPGIAPEHLPQLCDRFRRGDRASRDGAGLGLAIVARIAESCDGTLQTDPNRRELAITFQPRASSQFETPNCASGSCQGIAV